MKTTLLTLTICISLYAGIGAIKNTTNAMTNHNQALNQAMQMAKAGR